MKLSKFCASIAMVMAASTLASSANAADTAKRFKRWWFKYYVRNHPITFKPIL